MPPDRPAGRDAWAIQGFAPVPGDRLLIPRAPARRLPRPAGASCDEAPSTGQAAPQHAAVPPPRTVTVGTVYLCAEQIAEVTTRWTWIVLAGGELLEVAPRGCSLYTAAHVLRYGSGPYLELVAQDGALVRFEERVRAGTWQERPVHITVDGRRWRITATGTVTAHQLGPTPRSAWGQLSRPREQPVYATLAGTERSAGPGLALWATDVCVAGGRYLGASPDAAGVRLLGPS